MRAQLVGLFGAKDIFIVEVIGGNVIGLLFHGAFNGGGVDGDSRELVRAEQVARVEQAEQLAMVVVLETTTEKQMASMVIAEL